MVDGEEYTAAQKTLDSSGREPSHPEAWRIAQLLSWNNAKANQREKKALRSAQTIRV